MPRNKALSGLIYAMLIFALFAAAQTAATAMESQISAQQGTLRTQQAELISKLLELAHADTHAQALLFVEYKELK